MNKKEIGLFAIYLLITFLTDLIPFFASIYFLYSSALFSVLRFWKASMFFLISVSTLLINPNNWFVLQYPVITIFLLDVIFALFLLKVFSMFFLDKRLKHVKNIHS